MAVDNERGNGVVNADSNGRRILPGAQLITEELTRGFGRLKEEMDDNEELIEKKMERREKALIWVIFILVVFSDFALPAIAKFMYDLNKAMEEMTFYMKTMNDSMLII